MEPDLGALPRVVEPDADGLLRRIAPRIDDGMLREMAAADYDRDTDAHLAHLQSFRSTGQSPSPIAFEPKEVLELIRWSEPDVEDWYPGGSKARGHWMRVFACACLLKMGQETANIGTLEGQNQTVVQFIESIEALNAGLETDAAALLAWCISQLYPVRHAHLDELPFFGVGLLMLCLQADPRPGSESLISLCEWIAQCEALAARQDVTGGGGGRWLLSITTANIHYGKWEKFGARLSAMATTEGSASLKSWLALFGQLLQEPGR